MTGWKALEMGVKVIVAPPPKSKENIDTPRPKPISYRPISKGPPRPAGAGRRSGFNANERAAAKTSNPRALRLAPRAPGGVRARPAARARFRRRARALHHRLPDLWAAGRKPGQRGPGLPRPDRRPVRRRDPPRDSKAGLVGDDGRARQADRHRALLRHLRQCAGRLHGDDGPA